LTKISLIVPEPANATSRVLADAEFPLAVTVDVTEPRVTRVVWLVAAVAAEGVPIASHPPAAVPTSAKASTTLITVARSLIADSRVDRRYA